MQSVYVRGIRALIKYNNDITHCWVPTVLVPPLLHVPFSITTFKLMSNQTRTLATATSSCLVTLEFPTRSSTLGAPTPAATLADTTTPGCQGGSMGTAPLLLGSRRPLRRTTAATATLATVAALPPPLCLLLLLPHLQKASQSPQQLAGSCRFEFRM